MLRLLFASFCVAASLNSQAQQSLEPTPILLTNHTVVASELEGSVSSHEVIDGPGISHRK
ncbi:MAG: hypothetical protein U5L96_05730 [Owenweeksia sp.]|nr:hypothetical protein [Owenweeksia sp.]